MDSKKYYEIVNYLLSDKNKRQWPNEILLEEDQKKKNDKKAVFRSSLKRRLLNLYFSNF